MDYESLVMINWTVYQAALDAGRKPIPGASEETVYIVSGMLPNGGPIYIEPVATLSPDYVGIGFWIERDLLQERTS